MTSAPAKRLMTAEELAELEDDGFWQHELVRGKLVRMPPSKSKSAVLAGLLGAVVGAYILQHRLGVFGGPDWGFLLRRNPDTVRAPDFAFVRAERVPPGGVPDEYWDGAPDLAVEVMSPTDRLPKVMRKVQDYLDAGARLVWVLNPRRRWVRVCAPGREPVDLPADGVLDGEDVLPGFALPLRELWR